MKTQEKSLQEERRSNRFNPRMTLSHESNTGSIYGCSSTHHVWRHLICVFLHTCGLSIPPPAPERCRVVILCLFYFLSTGVRCHLRRPWTCINHHFNYRMSYCFHLLRHPVLYILLYQVRPFLHLKVPRRLENVWTALLLDYKDGHKVHYTSRRTISFSASSKTN